MEVNLQELFQKGTSEVHYVKQWAIYTLQHTIQAVGNLEQASGDHKENHYKAVLPITYH